MLSVVGLLLALPASAASKHIIISDSLLANSDELEVKRGGHFMGINKWRFGDYAVVASKVGWTHSGSHSNFWGTRTETSTSSKFSFVLSSKTPDSAFVSAEHQLVSRAHPGLKVTEGGTRIGGDDQTVATDHFVASITIARDTSETWDLFIGGTEVSEHGTDREDLASYATVLSHGDRRVALVPVFSKKLAEKRSFISQLGLQIRPPAMGFEFIEDGRSLCAVEYFSSGISGMYKNTVWMDRTVEPRMQLVLAAAMTAVLELECTETPAEPAEK